MKKSSVCVGIVLIGSLLGGIMQFPSNVSAANKEFKHPVTTAASSIDKYEANILAMRDHNRIWKSENKNLHKFGSHMPIISWQSSNSNESLDQSLTPMIRQASESIASMPVQASSMATTRSSVATAHHTITTPTNTVQLVGNAPLGQIATYHFSSDHEMNLLSPSVTQEMLKNKDTSDLITGELLGSLIDRKDHAWVVLMYTETGHIFDYDHNQIDSKRILSNYENNVRQENERYPNDPKIQVAGWGKEPNYNPSTRTLSWELKIKEGAGDDVVNDQARILTRTGYISAILVTDDADFSQDHRVFEKDVLPNIHINPGSTYTDYDGDVDKDSKLTLEGLILTGAGTAAAKTYGTFSIMNKLWFIVVPILALFYWNHRNRSRREREHAQELEAVMYADHQSNELPMRRRPSPVTVSNKLESDSNPSRAVANEVQEFEIPRIANENNNSGTSSIAVKEHATTMEVMSENDVIHHPSSTVTTEDSTAGDMKSTMTGSYNADSTMNNTSKNSK